VDRVESVMIPDKRRETQQAYLISGQSPRLEKKKTRLIWTRFFFEAEPPPHRRDGGGHMRTYS